MKKILLIIALSLSALSGHATEDRDKIMDYERQARKGDSAIQYKLGLINEFGIKSSINKEEAIMWYKKADKQSVIRATTRLGVIYYEDEMYLKAITYLSKSLKENEPLSIVYYGKNKLRLNEIEEAELYLKKGMSLKNPQSFFEYGVLEGDYKKNKYLGYINTKLALLKGYKKAKIKNIEYKNELSNNQLYSANDRIKRMRNK